MYNRNSLVNLNKMLIQNKRFISKIFILLLVDSVGLSLKNYFGIEI